MSKTKAAAMTKAEFARRWDSSEDGGGITGDDVAQCAVAWGLCPWPRSTAYHRMLRMVVIASGATTGIPPETTHAGEVLHTLTGEQLAERIGKSAGTGRIWLLHDEDNDTQLELMGLLRAADADLPTDTIPVCTGAGTIALLARSEYRVVIRG